MIRLVLFIQHVGVEARIRKNINFGERIARRSVSGIRMQ